MVLGLPPGGMPVAWEVAKVLEAPLETMVVREIGLPGRAEVPMGVLAFGGAVFLHEDIIARARIPDDLVKEAIERESRDLNRLQRLYRGGRRKLEVAGRNIILVDDGILTGGIVKAAIETLKSRRVRSIVLAAPVGATKALSDLGGLVGKVVCPHTFDHCKNLGAWYEDFSRVSDEEVCRLLSASKC
jgi:putative phosphoribosyl transferase